ncbi:hypothetical protein PG985_004003 [Apiospora marii]|uniref:Uncharacterized protein n=1 Tax=Apiospora marii TaxID=335849 RepID=A0ABR1SGH1_9PEZI
MRCKTKRQRKDVNTTSGELLSLRGGSSGGSTPSSPLFTEPPSSPRSQPTDKGKDGDDDDQYVGFVQNQNFILALYLAAGLEIPEGMSPPEDRSIIRHGIRAWELLSRFLSDSVLEGTVKPVLLIPDDPNAVPSMNTILRRVASICMKNGKPIFPSEETIEDDYDAYTRRADCSELMNYLMSILVWMVSSNVLLYYRLGFERVYWRVKLYMFIYRSCTMVHLYKRSTRPQRERESLYGENAREQLKGEMAEAKKNIDNITALQAQLRDDGKADLPRRTFSPGASSDKKGDSGAETAILLPGQRSTPKGAQTTQDPNAKDGKQDKQRKDGTPSKKKRPGGNREFGSGTNSIETPFIKAYDPFGNLNVWQANTEPGRVSPERDTQKDEWKQFVRDQRAAARKEGEKRPNPDPMNWEIYHPSQVDYLDQRTNGRAKRFGRPERKFWPAPVAYKSSGGVISYEL